MISWRWLRARLIIVSTLVKKLLLWPWRRSAPLSAWLDALAKENIAPTPKLLGYAAKTTGCIACGLCDVVAPAGEHPSRWIPALARNPVDVALIATVAPKLLRLAADIERVCPTGVSVTDLSRLIEDNAAVLARDPEKLSGHEPGGG